MNLSEIITIETSVLSYTEMIKHKTDDISVDSGNEYTSVRIPGLISFDDGTLIAYCESRSGDDYSVIDLTMRKSTDGGNTWSDRKVIVDGKGRNAMNNPVMIADKGTIHFVYCENYKRIFYKCSNDYGETWSAPCELTELVDKELNHVWTCIAAGPGHGTILDNGRLVFPLWFAENKMNIFKHNNSFISTLYSDDSGKSWHIGKILEGNGILSPNESRIAQLNDGQLLRTIRNKNNEHLRAYALSSDGGETWSSMLLDKNLPDPQCDGGICSADNMVFISHCANQNSRTQLTVECSSDNGKSWNPLTIYEKAGYSDIAWDPVRKCICVLFEAEDIKYIRFLRIAL